MTRKAKLKPPAQASAAGAALAKRRAEVLTDEQRSESARTAGLVGGPARAKKLSATRRRQIAQAAAAARWGKPKQ